MIQWAYPADPEYLVTFSRFDRMRYRVCWPIKDRKWRWQVHKHSKAVGIHDH